MDLIEYQIVLNAFVELRNRGVTVSSQDLEVLKTWADDGLPPQQIIRALEAIALEKQEKGQPLGNSLKALDRSIRRAVRESQDY